MEDGRQSQSVAVPVAVAQTSTTGLANVDLQDLETIRQGIERFTFISQAGSVLEGYRPGSFYYRCLKIGRLGCGVESDCQGGSPHCDRL